VPILPRVAPLARLPISVITPPVIMDVLVVFLASVLITGPAVSPVATVLIVKDLRQVVLDAWEIFASLLRSVMILVNQMMIVILKVSVHHAKQVNAPQVVRVVLFVHTT